MSTSKNVARILAGFLLSAQVIAQTMTPQYDSYASYTLDSNNNFTQTVVVEGTTTIDKCTFTYVCGPNNTQCTGTYGICISPPSHTASVTNTLGDAGGTTSDVPRYPFSYMSYQTSTTVNLAQNAGTQISGSWGSGVTCSTAGLLFSALKNITVRPTLAMYSLTTVNANDTATYTLNCPNNTKSTCGAQNFLGSEPHNWAAEFSVYVSPAPGCIGASVIQYANTIAAPYPACF